MGIMQKNIDKHGGILLYTTTKRLASFSVANVITLDIDAKSILDKREILGVVIGESSGKRKAG